MEPITANWLALVANAFLVALLLSVPILVGILIVRLLRRGVSEDRKKFEEELRLKLGEFTVSQREMKEQLEEISKRLAP